MGMGDIWEADSEFTWVSDFDQHSEIRHENCVDEQHGVVAVVDCWEVLSLPRRAIGGRRRRQACGCMSVGLIFIVTKTSRAMARRHMS